MPETVTYILGAGFSAPLGLPIMRNFVEKSKDLYFRDPKRYAHFPHIFSKIRELSVCKNYYESDLTNIEEILSVLEMEQFSSASEVRSFVDYLCDVIEGHTPKIEHVPWQGRPGKWYKLLFGRGSPGEEYGMFLANLLGLRATYKYTRRQEVPTHEIAISPLNDKMTCYNVVTLNYDMVLENMLAYARQRYSINEDVRFVDEYSHGSCLLAKLHGSVDERTIIPPTWSKVHQDNIKSAWRHAYEALAYTNHIRIVGYSLPISDSYIHYILKSSVVRTEHLKSIDVICRDGGGIVKSRYDDFVKFPNYRFRNGDVVGYMSMLDERTRVEERPGEIRNVKYDMLEDAHERFMAGG